MENTEVELNRLRVGLLSIGEETIEGSWRTEYVPE